MIPFLQIGQSVIVSNFRYSPNRYTEETAAYNVDITVFANDRAGLLAEVIQVLGNVKTKLIALNSKTTKEHIATIEITIEVENIEELNKVLKELRKIDSVYEVARKK